MIVQCVCCALLLLAVGAGALRAPRITEHPGDMTVARNDPVTLKCSADGNPAPVIEWYRDGELVISSASGGGGASSGGHRIMLPGGDLFFFRVILSRKESDAGVYWCTARNAHGVSRSRNATLTVAYLHADFRTAPVHTRGILGEAATLECEPPRGHPEPIVIWKKDGNVVDSGAVGARIRLEENGNLYFAKLTSEDEGRYQCLAQNVVGTRETPVALLSVHVRPVIVRPPQDSVALIGGEATLECGVKGDPPPHVEWRRQDGAKIPVERVKPVDGSKTSMRLVRLLPADSGRYVCEAENSVGSSSASAQLTILIPPSWNSSASSGQLLPREIRVNLDQSAYIDCPVQGSPAPLVFWRRDGRPGNSPELITSDGGVGGGGGGAGRAHRRWSVFQNGTLLISRVRRDDGGSVWCGAVSEAGSLMARTRIDVIAVSAPAPPVIEYGPANQTVPRGASAYLACSATDPALPVRWHKDGQALDRHSTPDRIKLDKESGALRIDHARPSDAGHYTCWVGKDESGSSGWTALLSVDANDALEGRSSPISRALDPLALPGSPSQPRLLERTSNSLTFAWQNGSRPGHSPLLGYAIEVFSSSDDLAGKSWTWAPGTRQQHSWRIVARHLLDDKFTLTDLQPATSYAVLVRAENSHGLSLPSLVSPWFATLPASDDEADGGGGDAPCHSSGAQLLHLDGARPLNATSARLAWRWLDVGDEPAAASHGAYVFYRATAGKRRNETLGPFRAEVVHRSTLAGVNAFTVTNLAPSLRYSFFMVPFCRSADGRPSNSVSLNMPEAAPDGPPRDLHIRQLNSTSCLVKWSEPLAHQQNGVITGYQIYVMAAEFETLLANMTLPASPTSVIIGNLVGGSRYAIRAAAWTSAGLGPPTDAAAFAMHASSSPHNTPAPPADDLYNYSDAELYPNAEKGDRSDAPANIVQEKWFILAIGGVILALLALVVLALFARRHWSRSKSMPSPVQKSEYYATNAEAFHASGTPRHLWVRERRTANETKYTYQFDAKKDPEAQGSLLPPERFAAPPPPEYAELLSHGESGLGLASFLGGQYEAAKSHGQPSAYATTTLISASPREPCYQQSSSSSERSKTSAPMSPKLRADYHQRAPNLNDFLPLPPRYPPPPGVYAEASEDDGSLPVPRRSPYKFHSAAPSPALSKRSAPATPSGLSMSRANRAIQSDEAKRRHPAHCASFGSGKLDEQHSAKRATDADSDGYQYGRFREAPPSAHDVPLRSPRARAK